MIRFFVFFLLINLQFYNTVYTQNIIKGIVLSKETKKPLSGVSVINSKNGRWTVTDKRGNFKIYIGDDYEICFHMLGKVDKIITDKIILNKKVKIYLEDKNLKLNEITITSTKNDNTVSSSIIIDKYGINQFQSFSLADILQQLPGKKITNFSLNRPEILSLRTANPINKRKNNSFGISYILDGMQLSNDQNMERYGKNEDFLFKYSNINTGFDLRNIPSSNIDKVEIIAGIPDAKYGNLTSGVIKIERRAGYSPLRFTSSINKGTTAVSIDRGFKIGALSRLSASLDYLNSNLDPRNNLEKYNRITSTIIFSYYNFLKFIKNTTSFTYQTNIDGLNVDQEHPNNLQRIKFKKNYGFRFNNRCNIKIKRFIDEIKTNISMSYYKSHIYMQSFENTGGKVAPVALTNSLEPGIYTPAAFMSKKEVFGNPININTNLIIKKFLLMFGSTNNISFGINFNYSDNKGKGIIYNANTAHAQTTISSSSKNKGGIRPLDYGKYIKAQKNLSFYVQDNIQFKINKTNNFKMNIGFRYDYQNGFSNFGPRINVLYKLIKKITIRGGLGFVSKSPSLASIFPGNLYFDKLIKDYRTNDYSFNLVQTNVKKIKKNILKPSKSWKYEIGSGYNFKWGNINIIGFYNYLYDGFSSNPYFEIINIPKIKFDFKFKKFPTYKIIGFDKYIQQYNLVKNTIENIDIGIELSSSFKKIKSINTSFNLSGNYTKSKIIDNTPKIIFSDDYMEKKYVIGYYKRNAEQYDYINFRLTTIHHIPSVKLLISLTSEFFPFSTRYSSYNSIYAYAYRDKDLNYYELDKLERKKAKYSSLFLNKNIINDIKKDNYFNFHLRLTKEMTNGMSMSFHATNFLNYKPIINYGEAITYANQRISFGGTIKYTF